MAFIVVGEHVGFEAGEGGVIGPDVGTEGILRCAVVERFLGRCSV